MPRHVRDFVSRRRGETMNRLYAVESTPTLTGARADHRRPMSPAAIEAFARSVAAGVGVGLGSPPAGEAAPFAAAVAADLKAHAGASLVVAGDAQPPSVHALAHAMNATLGNVGKTVRYVAPAAGAPAAQTAALAELAKEMAGGGVSTLVILGGNPVFNAPADLELPQGDAEGRRCGSASASTTTRPRASATGTSPRRIRSRAGATPAPKTAPSRSFSRSSRRSSRARRRTSFSRPSPPSPRSPRTTS